MTKGTEQLYLGLAAARKIKGGLELARGGAEQATQATNDPSVRMSLIQIEQNLSTVNSQCETLQGQLNQLVGLPPCTELELAEPPLPQNPFGCADDLIASAAASSPKIREARMQAEKAAGAVRLASADFVPTVNANGFYVNQDATQTIQSDFTGVSVTANYVLEWGKKNDTLRQWKSTEVLARQNLRKEIQDLELAATKAFNEVHRSDEALQLANQLVQLNRDAKLPSDPFQLKFALKDRLESEVGLIKADLDYRNAVVEVRSLAGICD